MQLAVNFTIGNIWRAIRAVFTEVCVLEKWRAFRDANG